MGSEVTIRRRSGYAAIPNAVIRDTSISAEARLMLCYIMSCSEDWKFYQAQSMKVLGCKRDKYQRIVREIKDAGYLIVHPKQDDKGRLSGWIWEVIDNPYSQDAVRTSPERPQDVACGKSARKPEKPAIGDECCENDRQPVLPSVGFTRQSGKTSHLRNQTIQKEKQTSCAPTDAAHTQDLIFEDFVAQFEAAYPRLGDGPATEAALKLAIEEGADPAAILAGARGYAEEQKGNRKQYIAYSENWLRDKKWTRYTPKSTAPVSHDVILRNRAKTIIEGKDYLCRSITANQARECIGAGLVTLEQCRAAKVAI